MEEPGRVSLTVSLEVLVSPAPAARNYIIDLLTLYLVAYSRSQTLKK